MKIITNQNVTLEIADVKNELGSRERAYAALTVARNSDQFDEEKPITAHYDGTGHLLHLSQPIGGGHSVVLQVRVTMEASQSFDKLLAAGGSLLDAEAMK